MTLRNSDLVNISEEMKIHLDILRRVAQKYKGTEVYRLCGTRNNMVVLDYMGKRICGLVSDKKGVDYGTLGTRVPIESDKLNALEVRGGYSSDPERSTLTSRYRYRPNWGHPYTINFNSYEDIEKEVERLLDYNAKVRF